MSTQFSIVSTYKRFPFTHFKYIGASYIFDFPHISPSLSRTFIHGIISLVLEAVSNNLFGYIILFTSLFGILYILGL